MSNDVILQDARRVCKQVHLEGLQDATILVTGASGLVGAHLLACLCHLHECGVRIRVYAQMLSDPPPHISELVRRGGVEVLRVNLANFNEYENLPEADVIFHSAGYAQPGLFMANPVATLQVNTGATAALLKRLRKNGRFLFLSSGEIYSGLKKTVYKETDIGLTTPAHPRASYIEGKRCGEAICHAFRAQGTHAISARLVLAYGPGTRRHDKRALNSFIEKALCHRRISLLDAGTAIRTYCYITDAVESLWQILLHGKEPTYNVGGRSRVTIVELAKMIAKMTGAEVVLPSTQAEIAGAPEEVCLDLTRIEMEFGKRDFIPLEEGLQRTIEWQRHLYAL